MKIFPIQQVREWDAVTVQRFYKSAAELMELASENCVVQIDDDFFFTEAIVFCGIGNNGGDGLCIARMLHEQDRHVTVFIVGDTTKATREFHFNMDRLVKLDVRIEFITESNPFIPELYNFNANDLIVDCLIGSGLSRKVEGFMADVIYKINALECPVLSVDLPSGLQADDMSVQTGAIIEATKTYSFQAPKRAMLVPENFRWVGQLTVLDIALDARFEQETPCAWHWYTFEDAFEDAMPRAIFSHKFDYGHLAVVAGSKGKLGAGILACTSAMRGGVGLVTAVMPECVHDALLVSLPESMLQVGAGENEITDIIIPEKATAVAIGPGLGQAESTALALEKFLKSSSFNLVLDADALNIIAKKNWHHLIPANAVLTPHVGEFDRLFGEHESAAERIETLLRKAQELQCVIVLKGARTATATPSGEVFFNSSGNPVLATAGSGDVLTGLIGAFLAQGYTPVDAARFAVYCHGRSGDLAAEAIGSAGVLASEIAAMIPRIVSEYTTA
jgi:NAD(P)H-hydrate epimerase